MTESLNDVMSRDGPADPRRLPWAGTVIASLKKVLVARPRLPKLLRMLWRLSLLWSQWHYCPRAQRHTVASDPTSTSPVAQPLTPITSPPAPATKTWVDLEVGECITEVPRVDLGEVSVTLVDCAAPHRAEMYFRAGIPVNAALDDVADQECGAAFPAYTGQPLGDGPLAMTYLIDSNQDRTVIDPTTGPAPSNVICLLEDANGLPLTGSARR